MTINLSRWFILGVIFVLTPVAILNICTLSTLAEETHAVGKTWQQALQAANRRDYQRAIALADAAEQAGLTDPQLFYWRGRWQFCAGNMKRSLQDFDRYVSARPERANSQWERGITCYYAKAYRGGAKQFEDYQKYHDNDVENAVWRYLCQAKYEEKAAARSAMLPIKNDTRIPMMEVYRLFRGESTVDAVLTKVAQVAGPRAREQRFDAHLYTSLYLHSAGDLSAAIQQIDLAVRQFADGGDYMWQVAVQHQKLLQHEAKLLGASKSKRKSK